MMHRDEAIYARSDARGSIGDGWRPWPLDEPLDGRRSLIEHDENGRVLREWVRDVPYDRADTRGGIVLTAEEAADAAEALDIAQESVDDYADQFSDVDARLDEGKTRAVAARMRALAARLEAAS